MVSASTVGIFPALQLYVNYSITVDWKRQLVRVDLHRGENANDERNQLERTPLKENTAVTQMTVGPDDLTPQVT